MFCIEAAVNYCLHIVCMYFHKLHPSVILSFQLTMQMDMQPVKTSHNKAMESALLSSSCT